MDVHFAICRIIFDRMKELGLANGGDTDAAVAAGAIMLCSCLMDLVI